MKRILSLCLVAITAMLLLAGCGANKNRILYSEFNLLENVTLAEYKGIKVDTQSKSFKEIYNSLIVQLVLENNFQSEISVTEGIIDNGDIVNIDYVGKKNGVAFDGGTAKAYDLIIGSNSFIDGFESGLIGKNVGSKVNLNLTFPEDYHSADLAGQKVVFEVKINSAKKALEPKDFYAKLGYETFEKFEENIKENAIENYLYTEFIENSKVKKYSEKDQKFLLQACLNSIDKNLQSQSNMTLEEYLKSLNQRMDDFEKTAIKQQVTPMMDVQMPFYTLLDNEGIEVTQKEIDESINKIIADYGDSIGTVEQLKEYYGEYYFESLIVREKALEFIRKNAKIS